MVASPSSEFFVGVSEPKSESQAYKRRKVVEKTVVRVKIGENAGKLKNEGPPSDLWSWRKYGQKPIKGSPYPRSYYRCSTSKGCLAKKQVERCRTDSSLLNITYTSSHNHHDHDLHDNNRNLQQEEEKTPSTEDHPTSPKEEQPQEQEKEEHSQPTVPADDEDAYDGHNFHYLQTVSSPSPDIMINQESFMENTDKTHDSLGVILDEDPVSCDQMMTFSAPKSEENDFFDELEELPTSSAFTSFMRGNFFDERIPVVPS